MAGPGMDLVKRSLHMIGAGAKDYVENTYGTTLMEIRDQAVTVRDSVLHDAVSSAQSGFQKIKRYSHVKNILDWFFDGSDQIESEITDDEWDSGEPSMDSGGEDDDSSSEPAVLSAESMQSISNKQTAALYRIGGKQSEISIANTAEVVKTIDTRTAEIVKALTSINTSINALANSFNSYVKTYSEAEEKKFAYYATNEKNKRDDYRPNGILNGSDKLGVDAIVKAIKESAVDSRVGYVKEFIQALGGSRKEQISSLIGMTIGEKIKIGGKSLNEIGENFDKTLNTIVQGSLAEMLNSKVFKNFVGDFTRSSVGADLRGAIKNNYNDQRAVFDNMTRKTIVDIIPSYLKKITEGITGQSWNIDTNGRLTTRNENQFAKIAKYSYRSTGLYGEELGELLSEAKSADHKLTQSDIETVLQAISISLVWSGKSFINPSMVAADDALVKDVITTLIYSTGRGDGRYWTPIVRAVLMKLQTSPNMRQSFIQSVNTNIGSVQRESVRQVNNNTRVAEDMLASGGSLTIDMGRDQLRRDLQARGRYNTQAPSGKVSTFKTDSGEEVSVQKVSKMSDLTTVDYTRGIFTLLNRGINVHMTGNKPFKPLQLKHRETGPALASTNAPTEVAEFTEGSGNFLDDMNKALLPKGVRMSMQHFARGVAQDMGVYDPTVVDEKGNKVSLSSQLKSNFFKPLTDRVNGVKDYIFGSKTGEGQNVHREGGLIQPLRDLISREKENIRADAKGFADRRVARSEYADAKAELQNAADYVRNMDNTKGSEENNDRIAAQHVFALMQTAVVDGDGEADIGRINEAINNIHDQKLRASLQKSVIPMVKANGQKTESKSLIGKLLSGGASLAKKLFSPIITVLQKGFSLIKSIGKKILSIIGRGIKSGARDIVSGASNIRRAFFGQEAQYGADGSVLAPETRGIFGSMWDSMRRRSEQKQLAANQKEINGIIQPAIDSTGVDKKAEQAKLEAAQKEADRRIKEAEQKAEAATEKAQKQTLGQRISALNPLTKIYENSEFLTGFTQAFRESKAKKEATRVQNLKTETVADRETEKLATAVEGKSKSVFTSILDAIKDIGTIIKGEKNDEAVAQAQGTAASTSGNTEEDEQGKLEAEQNKAKESVSKASANGGNVTPTATTTTDVDTETGTTSGGGTPAKAGTKFSIGQALGGVTSMLGGIFKIIMTILMSLEGFKVLVSFVKDTLMEAIQPLSKMFLSLKKAIAPVIKSLAGVVNTISTSLSSIAGVVIDLLSPVLEATSPILDVIGEVLPGLLDCLSILLKVIMAPLMGIMQAVIVPVLRQVANALEVVMGVLQFSFGLVISALGNILRTVSFGFGKVGDKGDEMVEQGNEMLKAGAKSMWSGTKKFVTNAVEQMNPVTMTKTFVGETVNSVTSSGTDSETAAKSSHKNTSYEGTGGSVMDGVIASGDVNSHNSSSTIYNTYNTYGAGDKLNQKSYGKYLNMSERGCGPIALADAYSRRTGKNIDPAVLAKRMYGAGMYDPNRGTSVNGLIAAGQALGMNTRVGRVTMDSVKRATPNNPVTLIGSGSGYATKQGNNHYVNVISSSKDGVSLVANPMTGRVSRAYTSSLVSGSKYGIYGSGDSDDTLDRFNLGDGFMDSFNDLVSTAGKILSIFNTDSSSTADDVNNAIQAEQDKETSYQLRLNSEEEGYVQEDVDARALEMCKSEHPREANESAPEYEKRISKIMDTYGTRYKSAAAYELYGDATTSSISSIMESTKASIDGGSKLITSINDSMVDLSNANGGYFANPENMQVKLVTDGYTPSIMTTDISGTSSGQSPLHEFFKYTTGATFARSDNGNWYDKRNNPDQSGTGSSGGAHQGIDILTSNKNDGTATLYPTTDGIVVESKYSETAGNMVAWKDSAGYIHRYLHMNSHPLVSVNQNIKGGMHGTLLGYIGNTGNSHGAHLHYDIREKLLSGDTVNPLTYFQYVRPAYVEGLQQRISIPSGLMNSTWNAYKNKSGVAEYFQNAKQAGLTPAESALIASVGIQEDSGKKIFGSKSLTGVTHDSNGQQAVGIMNWVDIDTSKYGSTIPDQLKYIKRMYFDDEWNAYQAKVRDPNASKQLPAFRLATGRDGFALNIGDQYGDTINSDLIEGASHFISSALVPASYASESGLNKYVGTAASIYNWMLDNGYAAQPEVDNSVTNSSDRPTGAPSDSYPTYGELQGYFDDMHKTMDLRNNMSTADRVAQAKHDADTLSTIQTGTYTDTTTTTYTTTDPNYSPNSYYSGRDTSIRYDQEDHTKNGEVVLERTSNWSSDYKPWENVDKSKLLFGSGDVDDFDWFGLNDQSNANANQPIVINKYNVTANRQAQTERLNMILNNTYNVRSERIEELLERILEAIEDDDNKPKSGGGKPGTTGTTPNLFDDSSIPKQVQKLYS